MSDGGRGHEPSFLPQLAVRRGRAAIEFYKAAFGAVEDYRVGGMDDNEDVVAQLSVLATHKRPEFVKSNPGSSGV